MPFGLCVASLRILRLLLFFYQFQLGVNNNMTMCRVFVPVSGVDEH